MKKITCILFSLFFFINPAEQEGPSEEQEQPQVTQQQRETTQEQPIEQQEPSEEQRQRTEAVEGTENKQVLAGSAEALEKFFSLFPNPEEPQFQLLPNLNEVITLVYEEALQVPPLVFTAIKRLYALMQSLALQENNINIETLSEQQQTELNNQILQRCIDSQLWQEYNKKFIVDSLAYGMSLLKSIHQEEKIIFTYIPNFETAYYSKGYTDIRNGSELVRLSLILSDGIRERSIQHTNWAKINNIDELYAVMEKYKNGTLYSLSQKIQTLLKSSKKYPFPKDAALVDHNGNITPAFNHFIYKENGKLVVSEYAQFIMNIDKNNQPYLTPFGNFIFSYQKDEFGPYLRKNPAFNDLFTETENGIMPQPLFLRMLALDAIKFLNAHMAYLFNTENLEQTMQKLVILEEKNPGILQQFPNILPYMPTDYPYLAGIKEMMPLVSGPPGQKNIQQPSVQSWHSFWHSVRHAFTRAAEAVANTAVNAWKSTKSALKNFGEDLFVKDFESFGKGVGYFFASAACAIADPKDAAKFFQRSFSNFSNMANDLTNAVDQVGAVLDAGIALTGSIVGQALGVIADDPNLANATSGLIDALGDGLVSAVEDVANYATEGALDIYRLSAEAVLVAEQLVVTAVTGGQGGTWSALKQEGDYFAKDIVTSILTELTFLADAIGAILGGIMKGIAYLCSGIVDLIGDTIGDIAALAVDMCGGNGLSVYNKIKNGVNRWRGTIIGGLLLVAGIAITVGSFGSLAEMGIPMALAAGTMMAAGTGMMVIGTVGDVQQNIEQHKKQAQQDAILAGYKSGIPQQEAAANAVQQAAMAEATVQFATEKNNSERGLVYYQNFLNQEFNATISTQSTVLGNFYQQLTMPDPYTGVETSDPGQLYGIKTGRMALNPAGGIYSFNLTRNTFAQEIATTPQQTLKTTQNALFTTSPATTGLWINQKDIANVWGSDGLTVEIRFRTIYETEGNFYVGLFMSEQVMDIPLLQALNKNYKDALELSGPNAGRYVDKTWENLDTFNRNLLNFNTLSRNFVIFREYGSEPSLGFYQHEGQGDGWLNKNIGGITYQRGVWYRMKMEVQGATTRVKCWEEAAGETNNWVSFQTPQAKRLPIIEPISLPNDSDPFELIVTKPQKSTPPSQQRSTSETGQQSPQDSGTSAWTVEGSNNQGQPQTQTWKTTTSQQQGPQTQTWQVTQSKNSQPSTVAWTVSGKEQRAKSQNISQALGSMGMISSGVAVEYEIISPTTKIEVTNQRKQENQQVINAFKQQGLELNEKKREQQWLLQHGTKPPLAQGQQAPSNTYQNNENPEQQPTGQQDQPQQQQQASAPKPPAHSAFWYLQHGQTPPAQTNINSKISSEGNFAIMGGPS